MIGQAGTEWRVSPNFDITRAECADKTYVLGPDRRHDGPEYNDEVDRSSEKSSHSQNGIVVAYLCEPPT